VGSRGADVCAGTGSRPTLAGGVLAPARLAPAIAKGRTRRTLGVERYPCRPLLRSRARPLPRATRHLGGRRSAGAASADPPGARALGGARGALAGNRLTPRRGWAR